MNSRQIAVLGVALAAQIAAAQTYTVPDEGGAAHKCMYRLRLTDGAPIEGVAFSPDGELLYLRTAGQAINVWELLVYYWPELLGGLSVLIALPCLLLLWRVRRRPRIVGEPHCRKCNYCVRGVQSGVCPECGRPIKRPVIGRTMWRRTAIPAGVLAAVLIAYGGMWALWLPRSGSANAWVNWWSYGLEDAAKDSGVGLSGWVRPVVRILDVDVRTGRTRRTLITRPAALVLPVGLVIVPSRGLLTTFDNELAFVDTQSGRVHRKLLGPAGGSSRVSCWRQVAGFEESGSAAYVVQADMPAQLTRLFRWDLRTGVATDLMSAGLDAVAYQGRTSLWPRRFFHVPGSSPPQFLELPSSMASHDDAPGENTTVRVHEIGAEHRIVGQFAASFWGYTTPVFSADGSRVYLLSRSMGEDLVCYTLPHGERCKPFPALWTRICGHCEAALTRIVGHGLWRQLSKNPLASIFSGSAEGFVVGDMQTGAWIGRFAKPADGLYPGEVCISPDARYFAAPGFVRERDQRGSYQHELIVYDLSSLPHEEVKEDPSEEFRKMLEQMPPIDPQRLPWPFGDKSRT